MKRSRLVLVLISLLAALLAGCVSKGYAGQADGSTTPPANAVDPNQQNGTSAAAGQTPSILGGTAQAGQVGAWERHRFFDVWEVGYPAGWKVDRPGTGAIVLSGTYGAHEYNVEVARPTGIQAKDMAGWVQTDLASIGQSGAPRTEAQASGMSALKVTNLKLTGQSGESCPAVRVYARTNKLRGEQDYLMITVSQTGQGACDPTTTERLADALLAEVGS